MDLIKEKISFTENCLDNLNFDPECQECLNPYSHPSKEEMCIYLHAFSFRVGEFTFQTPLPNWCNHF